MRHIKKLISLWLCLMLFWGNSIYVYADEIQTEETPFFEVKLEKQCDGETIDLLQEEKNFSGNLYLDEFQVNIEENTSALLTITTNGSESYQYIFYEI